MRARQFLILIPAVVMLPFSAFPKSAPCSTESVLVTVVDRKGNPVLGLQKTNFRAKLRHKPLKILSAEPWTGQRRALLLFDVSGSMTAWVPLEKEVGLTIVRQAPPGASFAADLFARRTEARVPFTTGSAAVVKEVGALDRIARSIPRKGRRTAIFEAISVGTSMFGEARPGDIICVITDGIGVRWTPEGQLERTLLAKGIHLYAFLLITLDGQPGVGFPAASGRGGIEDLTAISGGRTYALETGLYPHRATLSKRLRDDIQDLCRRFDSQLQRAYMIKVRFPIHLKKPESWRLEVVDQHGKANHHMSVFYPHLSPCPTAP